jgi:hypothetical protein
MGSVRGERAARWENFYWQSFLSLDGMETGLERMWSRGAVTREGEPESGAVTRGEETWKKEP